MQGSGETGTPDRRPDSRALEHTLQKPDVHDHWERDYRTPENARFHDRAFEYIAKVLNAPPQAKLLDAGKLMTRESNLPWLVRSFAKRGLTVKKRVAGQFTEIYVRVSPRLLQRAIHAWNHFWFCYVRAPGPAQGNILILEKQSR